MIAGTHLASISNDTIRAVCEAYEVLELFCELLLSRVSVMKLSKAVPAELTEAIDSLCYAGTRHQNLKELLVVRSLLVGKYGKEYIQRACTNANGTVNKSVERKLAIATPKSSEVTKYLTKIAQKYDVDWAAEAVPGEDGLFPEVESTKKVSSAATISAKVSTFGRSRKSRKKNTH